MKAEIIAIGSELLTPFRQDTNSLFLTDKLNQMGVEVRFKSVVGDSRADLVAVARIALSRCEIVIFMGGLGPTEDDLTREAVAEALGIELKRNPDLIADLYRRFAARRIKMSPNNERQADVLAAAEVLVNPRGSAPGQWLETSFEGKRRILMLLPGPPNELKPMFEEQCSERLRAAAPQAHFAKRVLKVAMVPESECDARIAPIYQKYPDIQTTILATAGEVQIHLLRRGETEEEAQACCDGLCDLIEEELQDRVFSTTGEALEQIVAYYLEMRGATLAVAESCTGGMLSERLTSLPGSSRYFLGGAIVYWNDLKTLFAGVPPLLIEEHGSVSREVAIALAEGIRARTSATLGVGITGIAGPGGGTEEKPVGLVYIALADKTKTECIERKFPGDRERVRLFSTQQALDMIRLRLM